MGDIRLGPPQALCLKLRKAFRLRTFIETGTYKGQTTVWAAGIFEQVHTIEGYRPYYDAVVAKHSDLENVLWWFGDSRKALPLVLARVKEPALVWLDAHWLGNLELSKGTDGECALMDELAALKACDVRHFIMIDDLHNFTGHLRPDADASRWPTMEELIRTLYGFRDYYLRSFEDVLIAVPSGAGGMLERFTRNAQGGA